MRPLNHSNAAEGVRMADLADEMDGIPDHVLEVMEATGMDLQDALVYLNVKNGGTGDVVEVPE